MRVTLVEMMPAGTTRFALLNQPAEQSPVAPLMVLV
jgi:hypothetical protein